MKKITLLKNVLIIAVFILIGINIVYAETQTIPQPLLQPLETPSEGYTDQNQTLAPINESSSTQKSNGKKASKGKKTQTKKSKQTKQSTQTKQATQTKQSNQTTQTNQSGQNQANQYQPYSSQSNQNQTNPYQSNPYQSNQNQANPYQPNPYQSNQNQANPYQPNQYQSNQYQQTPQNNSGYKCTTGNCPPPPGINSWNQQGNPNYSNRPPSNYQGQPPGYQGPPNQQMPYSNQMPPGQQVAPSNMSDGPQNVLIILDSSYSMEERIGGERKIDVAKRVVKNTLRQIPPDIRVGLRVYGHKVGIMGFSPCRKTELIVPIAFNTVNTIISKLSGIQPTGQTPISYSLITAANNDFIGINGPKRIILVSDGMETCDGDPCKTSVEMVRQGVDLKIDVVGFDLRDPAAINQLKCIALSTEGKFYTADTEAELARGLKNSFQFKKSVEGMIIIPK